MDNFRVAATVVMSAKALGWLLSRVSEAYYDRRAALSGARRAGVPHGGALDGPWRIRARRR